MHTALSKIILAVLCCLILGMTAFAADGETLYNAEYCFSEADFSTEAMGEVDGILVTGVPDSSMAEIRLGNRIILPGDVLSDLILNELRLVPVSRESCNAVLSYQPVYGSRLGDPAMLTIRIQSGRNDTPKAISSEFETYKNIENNGQLSASDPEEGELIYSLEEPPRRGKVKVKADGSFLYTPDKNKVGEDRFTFTVTDEAGNVSRPAAVNIRILSPSDQMTFADMEDSTDCFEAMWMEQQGLCSGRKIGTEYCFCPDEPVSRGEFLVMSMKLMNLPVKNKEQTFSSEEPVAAWMQPYLSEAVRRGIIRGERAGEQLHYRMEDGVTDREAAVMLQNMLHLPVPAGRMESTQPAWSAQPVLALRDAGIREEYSGRTLTRIEAARLLYQVNRLEKQF